jgi:hypothetical protein
VRKEITQCARQLRRHRKLFTVDPKLKDRVARLLRSMLPPRPRKPGRKPIPSVTLAIHLLHKFTSQNSTAKPEQIWAKVYPKAIPNYVTLTDEERSIERRRLRERVHSRKLQQFRRQKVKQYSIANQNTAIPRPAKLDCHRGSLDTSTTTRPPKLLANLETA